MKIVTASNGKKTVRMSKREWESLGKKAGWMKVAANVSMRDNLSKDSVGVYVGASKEPYFVIDGCEISELDALKVKEYANEVDWVDRGSKGWITPRLKCDDFLAK
jgi:hypothetical protein